MLQKSSDELLVEKPGHHLCGIFNATYISVERLPLAVYLLGCHLYFSSLLETCREFARGSCLRGDCVLLITTGVRRLLAR